MKLEVGKYYRTRDGQKVGPMEHWGGTSRGYDAMTEGSYIWRTSDGLNYPDEYGVSDIPELDLIAEWQDGIVRTVTHGTWSPRGTKPKTQYVYEISFDLDKNGHPDWSTATVTGK